MRTSILAVAIMAAVPLASCGSGGDNSATVQKATGPRLLLSASDTVNWQDVSAEIATVDQAQVLARIPGILTTLTVREGDMVSKGQVIGRIVDSQLGYQSGAYGAQAAAAQAQAGQAQAELARVKFLHQQGVYADARLDITAGPTVLRLEMPESLADKVHAGSRVSARVGEVQVTGSVIKLYPSITAGQVSADVAVAGLDNRLIGRRVAARVETGQRKALLVPASFVTTRYGIDYVTLLARDGSGTEVPVQTAPAAESGKVEVLSGVRAGDTLVGRR